MAGLVATWPKKSSRANPLLLRAGSWRTRTPAPAASATLAVASVQLSAITKTWNRSGS